MANNDISTLVNEFSAGLSQLTALTGGNAAGGGTTANAPAATATPTAAATPNAAAPNAAAAGGDPVTTAYNLGLGTDALQPGAFNFDYSSVGSAIRSTMMAVGDQFDLLAAKNALLTAKARAGELSAAEVSLVQMDFETVSSLSEIARKMQREKEEAITAWNR